MTKQKFERVYTLDSDLYIESSPVVIKAGALLKDTETSNIIAQLKFRNIQEKKISFIKIKILPLDAIKRVIGGYIEYTYLDLYAKNNINFGSKTPILLPDKSTRAFSVFVHEIGFTDNSIWCSEEKNWYSLPKQNCINDFLSDEYAIKEYKRRFGYSANNQPLIYKDIWLCSCGNINKDDKCSICENKLSELLKVDIEQLKTEGIYNTALTISKKSTLSSQEEAISLFSIISEFKDTKKEIQTCQEKIVQIKALQKEKELLQSKKKKQKKHHNSISIIYCYIICNCNIYRSTCLALYFFS